jgi:hypothetical protein
LVPGLPAPWAALVVTASASATTSDPEPGNNSAGFTPAGRNTGR